MEYAGFCPVALVSGQGFVLPGNRRIGYLGHDGKFYSPSTVDRAEQVSTFIKVEKILKNSLDLIPSPSVKIQIMGGKVCLTCKGKTLLGTVNKFLKTKSLLTSPSNVLPYYLK